MNLCYIKKFDNLRIGECNMVNLFSDITVKNVKIKNRIVMAPMVCIGWVGDDGLINMKNITHYKKRAQGGVGMIILEAHAVMKEGRLGDCQLGIWSDEHLNGLKELAGIIHKSNTAVLVQIHHAGFNTPENVSKIPVAPSDYKNARELTKLELQTIQTAFVEAACRAKSAGFDGIELHGAHGYLINQFMSPLINKREDEYGGIIDNRARFAVEIIQKIRKMVGEEFIIGYRMAGYDPTLEEGIAIAKILEAAGVDILHVSFGITFENLPEVPKNFPFNNIVYAGTEIKRNVRIPVIVVSDLRTPERAACLIDNGLADFVAFGKPLLVDEKLAEKAKNNEPINTCLKCAKCTWFRGEDQCPGKRLKP